MMNYLNSQNEDDIIVLCEPFPRAASIILYADCIPTVYVYFSSFQIREIISNRQLIETRKTSIEWT